MRIAVLLVLLATATAALHIAPPGRPNGSKPNILFILIDDLGFNELGFQNSTRGLLTPNLDALAHGGIILKNYYVQPICSPTRSALMTGRYPIHLGTQANVIYWDTPWSIAKDEMFFSENLKDAGYNTALYGKWHLGMHEEWAIPSSRGFDDAVGYLQGCGSAYTHISSCCTAGSPDHDEHYVCPGPARSEDFRGYDWFKNGVADLSANETNSIHIIRNHSVDFITRQAGSGEPWLLYMPTQNIHAPYTADAAYVELYANNTSLTNDEKTMFGYVSEVDAAVGDVIAALRATGQYENTVIIASADNGAPPAGEPVDHKRGDNPGWIARNYPFRGWKSQIWDGGLHVAGFVHSPLLPAAVRGTESHELYHVTDWLPTIVGLAGGSLSKNKPLDGHDIWESLTQAKPSPRTEMLYNINPLCNEGQAGSPKAGLRIGDYKLLAWCYNVTGVDGATKTGPVPAPAHATDVDPGFKENGGVVLYNLRDDPSESTNLASQQPQMVNQLLVRMKEYAEGMVQPMVWDPPFQGPDYYCASCPKHPAGTGPFVPWLPWITKKDYEPQH